MGKRKVKKEEKKKDLKLKSVIENDVEIKFVAGERW